MDDSLLNELHEDEHETVYQPLINNRSRTPPLSSTSGGAFQGFAGPARNQYSDEDVWDELNHHRGNRHHSNQKDHTRISIHHPSSFRSSSKCSLKKTSATGFHFPPSAQLPSVASGHLPDARGNIDDIDSFYIGLYNYYYQKGYRVIVINSLVNCLNLAFTIFLSTFLLGCVNWSTLRSCGATDFGCKRPLSDFISCSATGQTSWSLYQLVIFFYCFLFTLYWLWTALHLIIQVKETWEMHVFVTKRLKIRSTMELEALTWDQVLDRVSDLMNGKLGLYRITFAHPHKYSHPPSPHEIASRIMRRENYLIGLLNVKRIVNSFDPHASFSRNTNADDDDDVDAHETSRRSESDQQINSAAQGAFFSRNMEWNLHFCILNHMFEPDAQDQCHLKQIFLHDVEGLRRRLRIAGILNFFLMPFILLFMVIHFFLKYSQEWHTRRNYLGPRQWSPLAMWRFREFNELPHVFDARIAKSYPQVQAYQNCFSAPARSAIARAISFFSGSIIAILVVLSLVEEDILLETHVLDRQLLWYLTILTAIFTLARSFVPDAAAAAASATSVVVQPHEVLAKLASHIHYFPPHWSDPHKMEQVQEEVYFLFPYKIQLFFQECLSVIYTPFLLFFALPSQASTILKYISSNSQHLPHIGTVCRFACFDFQHYAAARAACAPGDSSQDEEVVHGKMEKSYLNFCENHPKWTGDHQGSEIVSKINTYRQQKESQELEKSIASLMLHHPTMASSILPSVSESKILSNSMHPSNTTNHVNPATSSAGAMKPVFDDAHKDTNSSLKHPTHTVEDSFSFSQQLLQSQAIQAALGQTQHENNFYWLEKYYQENQLGGAGTSSVLLSSSILPPNSNLSSQEVEATRNAAMASEDQDQDGEEISSPDPLIIHSNVSPNENSNSTIPGSFRAL